VSKLVAANDYHFVVCGIIYCFSGLLYLCVIALVRFDPMRLVLHSTIAAKQTTLDAMEY
jgi:hypothetical protein